MLIFHYIPELRLLPSLFKEGYKEDDLSYKMWVLHWLCFEIVFVSPVLARYFVALLDGRTIHFSFVEKCINNKDMKCYTKVKHNKDNLYFCIEPTEATKKTIITNNIK